jgi:hypothetical protein
MRTQPARGDHRAAGSRLYRARALSVLTWEKNTVLKSYARYFSLLLVAVLWLTGCSSYQPTKNIWKSTKGFWNTYVSPPASVDYEEKGALSPQALAMTNSMMGLDLELSKLERVMMNADKPPTREWVTNLFASFPWLDGFAGVKYDGTVLGQEPATPLKQVDFIPLLYEDKKQSTRALRADVQNTPLGPEVLLAAPLYDGTDFLGVVAAYFDMRTLLQYSQSPENIVILSPQALLWPGKYDFAATPLAGVNWDEVTAKSSSGTCTNATGVFYYMVRYLGNLPLVFAVQQSGTFPEGSGDVSQGLAFFPKVREKLPPPPLPERKNKADLSKSLALPSATPAAPEAAMAPSAEAAPHAQGGSANDIQPGSHDSVLLKKQRQAEKAKVRERQLEGANAPVERVEHPRTRPAPKPEPKLPPAKGLNLDEDLDMPTLPGGRPSPFGPHDDAAQPEAAPAKEGAAAPATAAPRAQGASAAPAATGAPAAAEKTADKPAAASATSPASKAQPEAEQKKDDTGIEPPATLPGGRPSPFGPRN